MPVRLERIEADIAELKVDVAELKTDVAELKTDVAELKTDVTQLKTDVTQLKTDVTQLKTDVTQLKTDVTQLKTDVGDLKGFALETLLHRRIRPLISQRLGLRRTRVMQSPAQEPVPALTDPVETGADNGVITGRQENRVTETDIIVRAQRQAAPTPVWVSIEASNKVAAGDIRRARETADILAAVFDEESIAVVAGYAIDPPDQARADATGVVFLQVSEQV